MAGTKVKTSVANLKYVFITGEGKDQAMKGEEPRMQFVASLVCPKDGETHKHFQAQLDVEWNNYKKAHSVKGLPKTNGIKDEMQKDPDGAIDPTTEEIKRVPTGNVVIGFKTNTCWPNGNPQVVKVKDRKGKDITSAINSVDWSIGEGSTGIIHGMAVGNNVGGTHKVTLYLSAVQIAKLVKYEGNDVDADEIEGEDIDLGDEVEAIGDTEANTPNL